jgi:hypothetical protein
VAARELRGPRPRGHQRQEVRGRLAAARHLVGPAVPRRRDGQPAPGCAGRRGIGVLRQRAGRPGPRPGHLRPAFRGEIVPLDIEILPSGTRFGPGETLRLVVSGKDIYRQPRPLVQSFHDDSVNRGPHEIHTGGRFDSHLLIPRAPG